jgi:hypothetical protein
MATRLSGYRSIVLWRKGRMSQSDPSRLKDRFPISAGLLGNWVSSAAARTDANDPELSSAAQFFCVARLRCDKTACNYGSFVALALGFIFAQIRPHDLGAHGNLLCVVTDIN